MNKFIFLKSILGLVILIIFLIIKPNQAFAASYIMQSGLTGSYNIPTNTFINPCITFPTAFASTPNVSVNVYNYTSRNTVPGGIGNFTSISPTQFCFSYFGNFTDVADTQFSWVATIETNSAPIKSGITGNYTMNPNSTITQCVAFPTAFASTPNVVISFYNFNSVNMVPTEVDVRSTSPTQFCFDAYGNATDVANSRFIWIAVLNGNGSTFPESGATGRYTITANATINPCIAFPTAFPSTPNVIVSAGDPGASINITSVSNSQFCISSYGNATGTINPWYSWIASLPAYTGNDAVCFSISPPANPVRAGQNYPTSIQMRNTGITTWTSATNFHLGSQDPPDNLNWGVARALLSIDNISPGGVGIFNFNVIAPPVPGLYNFNWEMVQDGVQWFGTKCISSVLVLAALPPTPTPTPTLASTPTPIPDYVVSGNVVNSVDGTPISGVSVTVHDNSNGVNYPAITNLSGNFSTKVNFSHSYAVRISSPPPGYITPPIPTSTGFGSYSWNNCTGSDTNSTDTSYECQSATGINDCAGPQGVGGPAGRCNFAFNPLVPLIISSCQLTGGPPFFINNSYTWTASPSGGDGNYLYTWVDQAGTATSTSPGQGPSALNNWPTSYLTSGTAQARVTLSDPGYPSVSQNCSATIGSSPSSLNIDGDVHSNR